MNFSYLLSKELIEMPAPLGFESWLTFWFVIIIAASNAVIMALVGYKFFQTLQLSSYKMKLFWKSLKQNKFEEW